MTDLPLLSVIMTTYDPGTAKRTALAVQTLEALRDRLVYPTLRWIIADDGSKGEHINILKSVLSGMDVSTTDAQRRGVGASKNLALQEAFNHSPLVLLLEDDWELTGDLGLIPYVKTLVENSNISMVRFGYLGGEMIAHHKAYSGCSYWQLQRGSGVYIYSGQVSLRRKEFYDVVGWHKTGCTAGEEELDMCFRFNAANGIGDILWPAAYPSEMNKGPFINIGLGDSLNNVAPENA